MTDFNSIVDLIQSQVPGLQAVYIFGSSQTQYETLQSDLDIAIIAKKALKSDFRWYLAQEIAYKIHRDVDLIDLMEASTVLRFEIISRGKRLYCREPKWCDFFETVVYSSYVRFNDERRELLDDINQRGHILHG